MLWVTLDLALEVVFFGCQDVSPSVDEQILFSSKLLPQSDDEAQSLYRPRNQKTKRPSGRIDDLVANIERQTTPHISQYAIHARARIKRTAQPDPYTGHASALQHAMQHNKHPNTTVHPNTGVPHTHYVSPMRCWTMNSQQDLNP